MKRIIILLFMFLIVVLPVNAYESDIIEQFNNSGAYDALKITEEYFEEFDSSDLVKGFLKGDPFNEKKIINTILDILLTHFKTIFKTFAFLVLCGIGVSFISNAGYSLNETGNNVGVMAGYVLFASALLSFFNELIAPAQNAITDITVMVKSLYMILIASVTISGGVVTVGLIRNLLFFSISIITELINRLLIPLIVLSAVVSAAGNMSDRINVGNITKSMRSLVKWIISFMMILFAGLFGVYGMTGSSIDASIGKTAKFIIGSSVPVIGGVVSDSLGTVLATVKAVRTITGNIGIIAIVLIAVTPILKTVVYIWSLKLCAGILEPLSDNRIVKLLNEVTQSSELILVCLISVTLLFVCGIAVVLISSNMLM